MSSTALSPPSAAAQKMHHVFPVCSRESYLLGIVCASDIQLRAMTPTLDAEHGLHAGKTGDDNIYAFGRIGQHNVVIVASTSGNPHSARTIHVLNNLLRSFAVRAVLLVGMYGGSWPEETAIEVGDVVVSHSIEKNNDVDQDGSADNLDTVNVVVSVPSSTIIKTLYDLIAKPAQQSQKLKQYYQEIMAKDPSLETTFAKPDIRENKILAYAESGAEGDDRPLKTLAQRLLREHAKGSTVDPDLAMSPGGTGTKQPRSPVNNDLLSRDLESASNESTDCSGRRSEGGNSKIHLATIFELDTNAGTIARAVPLVAIKGHCGTVQSSSSQRWKSYVAMSAACYAKALTTAVDDFPEHQAVYTPLDLNRYETRFLRIASVAGDLEDSQEIEAELCVRSLVKKVEYTALSYCWGDISDRSSIILNGAPRQVSANLEAALRALRRNGVTLLWVDALSIDQSNHHERIYQLSQIGPIFTKAMKVVAWLGRTANTSDHAMERLPWMAYLTMHSEARLSTAASRNSWKRCWANIDRIAHNRSNLVMELLSRPYWRRVWIIQEIAKARFVEIWCGHKILLWDEFNVALGVWMRKKQTGDVVSVLNPILTLQSFRDAEQNAMGGSSRMPLATSLTRTIDTDATIEKDKIYAILGLTSDGDTVVPIPSYMQDDMEVFDAVLEHMIVKQGRVNLILLASRDEQARNRPSWLPVWRKEKLVKCGERARYFSSTAETAKVPLECHDRTLSLRAHFLGTIWPLTPSSPRRVSISMRDSASTGSRHWDAFFEFCVRSTDRWGSSDLLEPDTIDGRALIALWSLPPRVISPYALLSRWYENHKTLRFEDLSLEACFEKMGEQLYTSAQSPQAEYQQRNLFISCASAWLQQLEKSLEMMARDGMLLMGTLGRAETVLVPKLAQKQDYVVLLPGGTLPVVLRHEGGRKYSVVGALGDSRGCDVNGQECFRDIELI